MKLRPTPKTKCKTALAKRATDLALTTLIERGQQVSQDHATAIAAQMDLMTELATAKRWGRIVVDLDTGLGKTTSVECWLKEVYRRRHPFPVVYCAEKITQLCDVYKELTTGAKAVKPS